MRHTGGTFPHSLAHMILSVLILLVRYKAIHHTNHCNRLLCQLTNEVISQTSKPWLCMRMILSLQPRERGRFVAEGESVLKTGSAEPGRHVRHSFLLLFSSISPSFCRSGFHSLLKVTQIDLAGWQGVTLQQPQQHKEIRIDSLCGCWGGAMQTHHAGFRTNIMHISRVRLRLVNCYLFS